MLNERSQNKKRGYTGYGSICIKFWKMQPTLTESSSVDAWGGVGHGGAGGKNSKGQEDTLEGDGYIHYLDSCDSFLSTYIHQMFSNQTL